MWPSSSISSMHSVLIPPFTVVQTLHSCCKNSFPLLEWQQVHLSSHPQEGRARRLAQSRGQQTGRWPVALQKSDSPVNRATQIQILVLKRKYFPQGSSSFSAWGERKRGTPDVSKVCTCQHLNQTISCTRTTKQITEVKLLLICCF